MAKPDVSIGATEVAVNAAPAKTTDASIARRRNSDDMRIAGILFKDTKKSFAILRVFVV